MSWPSPRLKHFADIRVSSVDKESLDEEIPVRLCNYTDVYYRDTINSGQEFMAATATPDEIKRFHLEAGDVIITKDSESPDDIGVPAFVNGSAADLVCGYHLAVLRPDPAALDGRFLYWLLMSRGVSSQLEAGATGVTRFGLRSDVIENAVLNVPHIEEQRRIAVLLNAEVARLQELVDLKKALLLQLPLRSKAAAHELLAHLPRNGRLAYSVSWLSGGTPPKSESEHWAGDVPWVSTKDLGQDVLDDVADHITRDASLAHSKVAPPGSVLVATRGMALAKRLPLATIKRPMAFNQDLKGLVPGPGLEPRYLRLVLRAFEDEVLASVVQAAHGTRRLETSALKRIRFPALAIGEQRRLIDEIAEIEAQNTDLAKGAKRHLELLDERRDALITAAVSGQIDPTSYREVRTRP